MKKRLLLLLAALLLTTLACSVFSGSATETASDEPAASAPASDEPAASAPASDESDILFSDDFSDSTSGWDQVSWEDGLSDYENGVYRMRVQTSNYDIWANPGKYFDGDVRIDVDATKVDGDDDNDFGLICRYSGSPDSPSYYFFSISSDGFSVIGKVIDGTTEYLSDEQMMPTNAVKQGATTNHLRADCIGNTLTLYVNGQKAASTTDDSLVGGDIGFIVGTFDVPVTEITFDNLVVRKP